MWGGSGKKCHHLHEIWQRLHRLGNKGYGDTDMERCGFPTQFLGRFAHTHTQAVWDCAFPSPVWMFVLDLIIKSCPDFKVGRTKIVGSFLVNLFLKDCQKKDFF